MLYLCCVLSFLPANDIDDLKKSLRTIGSAESYLFTVQDESGSPVTGTYQKGSPIAMRADDIDFFREAKILVYRNGGIWTKTRTGTLSDPLPILAASAKVSNVRMPHEELMLVDKAAQNIRKADGRKFDFLADLDAAGARSLARSEDRELARSGTVQFWVNGEGQITKYRLTIRIQGKRGNADVDGIVTRTIALSDVGRAKVEVPDAVKMLLRV